ncbi:hypothetical protein RND81_11G165200 [Saponaria officinalis]|uniref:PROP1-like PPR domain-containing protein n=2 Tax=Saponaria officinalis TaxID=3572 RepID=A0AAW1HMV4_SAPOF
MEAFYSPSTQTLALIPRSSSSPSSSSVCLCSSRIQSIRTEFFGRDTKLRLRCSRNLKRLRSQATNRVPVALFSSLPAVAIAVAVTISAAAFVFSNLIRSKQKNNSDEVPGPPSSENKLDGGNTGEYLYVEAIKSTSQIDDDMVKLSFQDIEIPDSTLEDTPGVENVEIPDSHFDGILSDNQQSEDIDAQEPLPSFALESESSSQSEVLSAFVPKASPELDEPVSLATEKIDARALSEDTEEITLALPEASPDLNALEPQHFVDEPNLAYWETNLKITPSASAVEAKDPISNLSEKDDDHEVPKHEHYECETSNNGYTGPSREDLYSFYEHTSTSDNIALLPEVSDLSTKLSMRNNNLSWTTRTAATRMLLKDRSLASGSGGQGTAASPAGYTLNGRKDTWKKRGGPKSDTQDPSKKFHKVPDMQTMQVNGNHTSSSYMTSYNRLLRKGRLHECAELLKDMDSKEILDMSKIYHAKFFNLCRGQKAVKEAFSFAKLIPNPTLSTFNMLMSVCSAAQDSEGAFNVMRLVREAGLKADYKLYTTLISTCAKSGKVDKMFEVFHEMVNSGEEPNVHTYGALIDGCARAGQVAKAFGAYGILRSKADRVKGVYKMIDQYDIKGTPELYTIAVSSCSQAGDWEFACNVYADMKKKDVIPDEMFFSALIHVAGRAGKLDAAFEILQDAKTQGMNPGIVSYSSLMGACSNTKNWERALELFEQIKAMNLKPAVSTVNALITALSDAGQMQKALDVLSEMKELGLCPNDVTYSILIAASERNDDIETGLTLFYQAKADGVPFSQIMCKCLIKMCFRRFEKASTIGEPVLSFKSGRPQIDSKWSSLALTIYRDIIGAGLVPSEEMLSHTLGCLQLPQDVSLKQRLMESLEISGETSRNANFLPLVDGFAEYDLRAFSLFEEAALLGIVPCASFKDSPIVIDTRSLNAHIAKVYILTVLRGLKHRLAAGAKLPTINILLSVETTKFSSSDGEKIINVSGRVSQTVGALLRRLRLPYQGNESHGKIRITGLSVKRWFQPKLNASLGGKQSELGLFQLGLTQGILNQRRSIRTGSLSLD